MGRALSKEAMGVGVVVVTVAVWTAGLSNPRIRSDERCEGGAPATATGVVAKAYCV
jgi:hypothetical protein